MQDLLHRHLHTSDRGSKIYILIFALFARASLIYINAALRELLVNVKLFQEISNMIEQSMDIGDRDLDILLRTFPDLMLWVLFWGGSAAILPRKTWFAEMAARILVAGKTEDTIIRDAASAFLWPEGREKLQGQYFA